MAAAAVPRSRSLYFLFTLMCLVCLASSLIDKNNLKNMKENLQKRQQDLDKLKAQRALSSELFSRYDRFMGEMMAYLKKSSEESPDDFLPLAGFMESTRGWMENARTFVDGLYEDTNASTEKSEQELEKMKNLIAALEEYQAEL